MDGLSREINDFDLIIKNGTLVDGTGKKSQYADIAIKNGLIAAIGTVSGKANQEIDATDLVVTPGFVDIHTHYDGQAIWDSQLKPSSIHGVVSSSIITLLPKSTQRSELDLIEIVFPFSNDEDIGILI